MENEINETIKYILDRFIEGKVEPGQILALSRTMKDAFGVESEEAAEKMAKDYLAENGYLYNGNHFTSTNL
ncbi:hypothetical protein [Bacillus sp. V5-8f]|uniref:hypothetical protein n=1 Tax=Bacillus sp. V5-8f TaxID=2053044 RepID=UPI000C774E2A|nr:hypothetical protein [Bacillus sp. V5-8f]PLT35807.1 hypothetical protein CUU64_00595 [Bacillus sp. V5-8f]